MTALKTKIDLSNFSSGRLLLEAAKGRTYETIAKETGLGRDTVSRILIGKYAGPNYELMDWALDRQDKVRAALALLAAEGLLDDQLEVIRAQVAAFKAANAAASEAATVESLRQLRWPRAAWDDARAALAESVLPDDLKVPLCTLFGRLAQSFAVPDSPEGSPGTASGHETEGRPVPAPSSESPASAVPAQREARPRRQGRTKKGRVDHRPT